MSDLQAWAWLLALGAFHGINPGMGWLFAVALGMQEKRRRAVLRSVVPIALGHALSIGAVALIVVLLQKAVPLEWLVWPSGVALILFGVFKLFRSRHPRWVGMRVTARDLVLWSFLMASAHGAGLMLVPVLLGWSLGADGAGDVPALHGHHGARPDLGPHAQHADAFSAVATGPSLALVALVVHTIGYLMVMLAMAMIVYEWVGVAMLRKAWLNLDIVWALALIVAGAITLSF